MGKLFFLLRAVQLAEAISKLEERGLEVLSVRAGGELRIKGGKKDLREVDGKTFWRKWEIRENQEEMNHAGAYLFTKEEVWKVTQVDKTEPMYVGKASDFDKD